MTVCPIVKTELFYGELKSNKITQMLGRQWLFLKGFISLPFKKKASIARTQIWAELHSPRMPIKIALANDVILSTHNTRQLKRFKRLQIKDKENAS